jgi:hypothetical protein
VVASGRWIRWTFHRRAALNSPVTWLTQYINSI